jgi:hypothetical protein
MRTWTQQHPSILVVINHLVELPNREIWWLLLLLVNLFLNLKIKKKSPEFKK